MKKTIDFLPFVSLYRHIKSKLPVSYLLRSEDWNSAGSIELAKDSDLDNTTGRVSLVIKDPSVFELLEHSQEFSLDEFAEDLEEGENSKLAIEFVIEDGYTLYCKVDGLLFYDDNFLRSLFSIIGMIVPMDESQHDLGAEEGGNWLGEFLDKSEIGSKLDWS